jgi:hypothetical protein
MALTSLTACALFEERKGPEKIPGPREKIFNAGFEDVWKSVNLVLQPYPLRISNMDQGILETDVIRAGRIWTTAYPMPNPPTGEVYKLIIRVIKGSKGEKTATKVSILKDTQVQVDFFSDPKTVSSDGMEETSLLYRIDREIMIERALARAQKKQNEKQQ